MPPLSLLLICLSGALVSGFGNLIGFGGGVFMIPILVIGFHVPIHAAIGAVVSSLFPAALIATYHNWREDLVDPAVGVWLEVPTIIGTALGAYLTAILSVQTLEVVFSIFVVWMSYKMFRTSSLPGGGKGFVATLNKLGPILQRNHAGIHYRIGAGAAIFFGMSAGLVSGLFGIGGGFLKTPIMIRVFGLPAKIAVGTALFMIVFTSLTAILAHYSLGHIHFQLTAFLMVGFTVGALTGNRLKRRFSDLHTEKLITIGLFLAGISTLIYSLSQ